MTRKAAAALAAIIGAPFLMLFGVAFSFAVCASTIYRGVMSWLAWEDAQ